MGCLLKIEMPWLAGHQMLAVLMRAQILVKENALLGVTRTLKEPQTLSFGGE